MNAFIPISAESAKEAVHIIKDLNLREVGSTDLLTVVAALDRQVPRPAKVTHKPGAEGALIECDCCGQHIIANYALYRQSHREWYCKRCGQRCVMPDDPTMESGEEYADEE